MARRSGSESGGLLNPVGGMLRYPLVLLFLVGSACGEAASPQGGPARGIDGGESEPLGSPGIATGTTAEAAGASGDSSGEASPDAPDPERFPRPERMRGIYLNAWASGSSVRTSALVEWAHANDVNTFVLDLKDATGFISHRTSVPMAQEVGADGEIRIRDLPALLDRMEAGGIYPVARIVVFLDPLVARGRPDLAIQNADGNVWVDGRGDVWVNPWSREVWDYHVELAREAAELGFPEVQWDYVRFPDRPSSEMAGVRYPGADGGSKSDAIRGFLMHARDALADLDLDLTADVFGMATTVSDDVGIGQHWESFIDVVDAALPMVYPSHYAPGSFGLARPNAHPYEVVRRAVESGVARSREVEGAGRLIPWLQAFTLGAPPYGAAEVLEQIRGARDAGVHEWILWNPGARYPDGIGGASGGESGDPEAGEPGEAGEAGEAGEPDDAAGTAPRGEVQPAGSSR
ncbi:MAG: GTP-binding protein [Gemmatimonadales bacterium]|nr:MAG: GTP-binding protein [Gemmatimonadales bacterium]